MPRAAVTDKVCTSNLRVLSRLSRFSPAIHVLTCFNCLTGHVSAEIFSLQVSVACATRCELQEVQDAVDRLEQRDRGVNARFAVVLKQLAEVHTEIYHLRKRLRWAMTGVCITGCCCAALALTIWRRN